MKISTNSTLFRSAQLWSEFLSYDRFRPQDLCEFVRRYFFSLLFKIPLVTMIAAVLIFGIFDAALFVLSGFDFWVAFGHMAGWQQCITNILGLLLWAVIGALLAIRIGTAIGYGIGLLLGKTAESVIGEYVSGKLHKFCPRIEYTTGDEK